jgi:hypothetical protein
MDSELSVVAGVWERLTGDATLMSLLGGPDRVHLGLPDDEEPPFPYLNHRVDTRSGDDKLVRQGTYFVDVWDYSDTADRAYAIRERVVALLDESVTVTPTSTFRLSLAGSGTVPDPEPGIRHLALAFDLYLARAGELAAIAARSEP